LKPSRARLILAPVPVLDATAPPGSGLGRRVMRDRLSTNTWGCLHGSSGPILAPMRRPYQHKNAAALGILCLNGSQAPSLVHVILLIARLKQVVAYRKSTTATEHCLCVHLACQHYA
jgi:hypothetical protein